MSADEALRKEPAALAELKRLTAERCAKFGADELVSSFNEVIAVSFEAGVQASLEAAHSGFEKAMERYVVIGPSGMAAMMLNHIRALKVDPNE